MILEGIWGPRYVNEHHYLKVYAYRIRKKLHDEQGKFLQNDPSVGYRLAVDGVDIGPLGIRPRVSRSFSNRVDLSFFSLAF